MRSGAMLCAWHATSNTTSRLELDQSRLKSASRSRKRQESNKEMQATSSQPQQQHLHHHHHQQRPSTASTYRRARSLAMSLLVGASLALLATACLAEARVTFEKMTNRDFSSITYYSQANASLFECLGWCKDDQSCTSAVFSFQSNAFVALQETNCQLQNETQAKQSAYLRSLPGGDTVTMVAQAQRANNMYFFNKIELPTDSVCSRLWAFERFANRRLRHRDRQAFQVANKEACQAACMNEQRFVCRSLEYNYISQQCSLSGLDRRSPLILSLAGSLGSLSATQDLIEAPGVDYFENACLLGEDICNDSRVYDYAKVGLAQSRTAHYVELSYYPDKEMLVKSQAGCARACTIEHEFICRSILYRSTFKQGQPNCALYHLDHRTFPDGAETFSMPALQPLLDSGETSATYLEAVCNDTIQLSVGNGPNSMPTTLPMPSTSITIVPSSTTPGGISILPGSSMQQQQQQQQQQNNGSSSGSSISASLVSTVPSEERYLISTSASNSNGYGGSSTLPPLGLGAMPTTVRLPGNFFPTRGSSSSSSASPSSSSSASSSVPSNFQISDQSGMLIGHPNNLPPARITLPATPSRGMATSQMPPNIVISPAPPTRNQNVYDPANPNGMPHNIQIIPAGNQEHNCDSHGFCYDVSLKCTDMNMVVNVHSHRPFDGRIYALGRSETCNSHIKNQKQFQLEMPLTGKDCNTQSASGTYTNTIVLQHHNVVLTKADKVYHVRCTYETSSRNVSFGMMPVKDMFEVDSTDRSQETISITANSDAPLPKISILTTDSKEANTVRIGDALTFRIEIPDNTPYGIFARSCVAMAKDSKSTFEIIDENGCPIDQSIFPNFQQLDGNALESHYEAFRFTESYGVIFQCNVKYCIGKCAPVVCGIGRNTVESFGRRKRSIGSDSNATQAAELADRDDKQVGEDMTLSREIIVLDLSEKDQSESESPPGELSASRHATRGDHSNKRQNNKQRQASLAPKSLKQAAATGASGQTASRSTAQQFEEPQGHDETAGSGEPSSKTPTTKYCLTSHSLSLMICSIGLLFVLYVCALAFMFARRDPKVSHIEHQFH